MILKFYMMLQNVGFLTTKYCSSTTSHDHKLPVHDHDSVVLEKSVFTNSNFVQYNMSPKELKTTIILL